MTTSSEHHQHSSSSQLQHHHQHTNNSGMVLATGEDGQASRRMSDPVRPLDRNYGVGGQLSRHRSYGNLQGGGASSRMPLHQQRIRGQEGGAVAAANPSFMGGDPALAAQAQQQVPKHQLPLYDYSLLDTPSFIGTSVY